MRLLDGDEITLTIDHSVFALGMFFITTDPVLAGEIQLVTFVGTALGSDVSEGVLADGGITYFPGLTSTDPFTSALIDFADDGEMRLPPGALPPRTSDLGGRGGWKKCRNARQQHAGHRGHETFEDRDHVSRQRHLVAPAVIPGDRAFKLRFRDVR